jgi:hypothetical protein
MSLHKRLENARQEVRRQTFGTDAWEAAMVTVRALCEQVNALRPPEEFCSVDSGVHRSRLLSGRIV